MTVGEVPLHVFVQVFLISSSFFASMVALFYTMWLFRQEKENPMPFVVFSLYQMENWEEEE